MTKRMKDFLTKYGIKILDYPFEGMDTIDLKRTQVQLRKHRIFLN